MNPLILCFTLSCICFVPRYLPFFLGKRLMQKEWVSKLSVSLPPCIMLIVVAYTLEKNNFLSWPGGMYQLVGVGATIVMQIFLRRSIISMAVGVLTYHLLTTYA